MYACLKMGLVATALISTSVVANAADAPTRAQLATLYNWTGFYAGGHVGVGWVGDGDSGILGGGQVGYNFYQTGPWVLGAEADLSAASKDLNWTSTLAARLGFAFNRWLVYGKVGGAWANFDHGDPCDHNNKNGDSCGGSKTASGLLLGAGVEYALQNNWSAKFEYNRMDFDHRSDVNVFKIGLNYRFGLNPLPRRW